MTKVIKYSELIDFLLGEKWFIEFTNPDGTKNGGFCNSSQGIENAIKMIRELGGKNIVFTDQTVGFYDEIEE